MGFYKNVTGSIILFFTFTLHCGKPGSGELGVKGASEDLQVKWSKAA